MEMSEVVHDVARVGDEMEREDEILLYELCPHQRLEILQIFMSQRLTIQ